MTVRNYTIPAVAVVTVDAQAGTVEVEIDLTDLSFDLRYDYEHPYPDKQTEWDQQVITDRLMDSPANFTLKTKMTKVVPE